MSQIETNKNKTQIDYESIHKLISELEKRKNRVSSYNTKFFDVFVKSLFRNNIAKVDSFVNSLSDT